MSARRSPPAAPSGALRLAGWAALAVALVGAAAALLPLEPMFPSFVIDNSFGATLHYEAATRSSAGTHLISTYGPLGFAYYPVYLPETFGRLVAVQAVLGAILAWALTWVGWAAWHSPWGAALAVAGCAPLLGPGDVRFWMLPLLAVLIELADVRPPLALRLALGAAVGLIGLIKVSFLTAAVVALVPLAIMAVVVEHRPPFAPLSAAAAMALAWLMLGLGWRDWLAYLDWSSREITPGYSAAMQIPSTIGLVVHAVAVMLATLAAGALLARRAGRSGWWLSALALAGLLFLLFKAGFVRADVHVFITSFGLLAGAILLALLAGAAPRRVALGAVLVAVLPGTLLWHAIVLHGAPTSVLFSTVTPAEMASRLAAIPGMLFGDTLQREHEKHAGEVRAGVPLPVARLPGSFDIYPYQQNLLLAYGVEFRPRPVFQSYMAYTPRLAHANAESLAGEHAPQWILFQPGTIDGRFPALDDAAAWPELLARYQLVGVVTPFAVLQKRPTPISWRLLPLDRRETSTDTSITVPPGLVWARIDVDETLGDRISAALFTAPYVYMDVTFADGTPWRYRLIPAIARDGFLLSPMIGYTQDLATFIQRGIGALAQRAISQVRIHVDTPFGSPLGPRPVKVEFFELQFGGG